MTRFRIGRGATVALAIVMLAVALATQAPAQSGGECKNVAERIAELNRRIEIYEKRLGNAQVEVYEARLERDQAEDDFLKAYRQFIADPKNKGANFFSTSAGSALTKKSEDKRARVAQLENRISRIERDISGYKKEINDLLTKPCPPANATPNIPIPQFNLPSGFFFSVSLGGRNGHDNVTNAGMFTLCPPFCTPDQTPNPTARLRGSGVYGGIGGGFNTPINVAANMPLVVGVEGFVGFANSNVTMPGIPGTFGPGGIATAAVALNDSTKVNFGNSFGILGRIGAVVPAGAMPLMVSFLGGVGFQEVSLDFNCTALGACGTNGIAPQVLSTSRTLTGVLLGGEIAMPIAPMLGSFNPMTSPAMLRSAMLRFQYLHGDFGTVTQTLGSPSQIQITAQQKVTTSTFTGGLVFPIGP